MMHWGTGGVYICNAVTSVEACGENSIPMMESLKVQKYSLRVTVSPRAYSVGQRFGF